MSFTGWPFAVVLGFGTLIVIALLAGWRRMTGHHRCPLTGRPVVLVWRETVWNGQPVDVESCSAFTPPTAIACNKVCLRRSA